MENFAERVMRSYKEFHLKYPNINYQVQNLLEITNNNVGRLTLEKKMRFVIQKVIKPDVNQLILSNKQNVLYHCVLLNNHAVVILDQWIFDPALAKTVPKNKKHLRLCAQAEDAEDTNALVFYAYKYN